MKCGLLGRKLSHSYSPQIHRYFGDYAYPLYEKEPDEVGEFLLHGDFTGLNVTIPFKKEVLPYCAELTPVARRLGAVNTIVRKSDGTLIGHNTDYFGFETMLMSAKVEVTGKKALVLGSGGAAQTAIAVLRDHGAKVVVISRTGENNYQNLHLHKDAFVIVNATPVGMYPNNGISPVNLDVFPHLTCVLDMIYNPARTRLLLDAMDRNIIAVNGLIMLVAQAKESAQWFLGKTLDDGLIDTIHAGLRRQMENIILIGMPGSGKTTVGKILSEKTEKPLIDADTALEAAAGRTIPEIFASDGEAGFRALETEVLQDLGKRSGIVLSTGGGCVTREENLDLLRQNGTVFCLERSLDLLPTEGRPLSQIQSLREMYRVRKPLYRRFASHLVYNNTQPESAAGEIIKIWEENQ